MDHHHHTGLLKFSTKSGVCFGAWDILVMESLQLSRATAWLLLLQPTSPQLFTAFSLASLDCRMSAKTRGELQVTIDMKQKILCIMYLQVHLDCLCALSQHAPKDP
jgi:hypothetical protein